MRTLAQKRAEYALKKTLASRDKVEKDKFKSFTAGAPAAILRNGFGHTLAFWLSKGKPEHVTLFEILTSWLQESRKENFGACRQPRDYMQTIATIEQGEYLAAQNEALALLEWVKRFAAADLE